MPKTPPKSSNIDLDAMAEVTQEDVEVAKSSFRKHAPREVRNLLDAKVKKDAR
jgi:hypothetical protein